MSSKMNWLTPEEAYTKSECRLTQLKRKDDLAAIRIISPGVTDAQWDNFEQSLGCGQLPASCREFYQFRSVDSARFPRDTGYLINELDQVMSDLDCWMYMTEQWQLDMVEEDDMVEVDLRLVKPMWFDAAWIPFLGNGCGDHICMDCNPGPEGRRFQMIEVYHDDASRHVVAQSWDELVSVYMFKEE